MTTAWDAQSGTLKEVSADQAKELSSLGVPTGAEAELKARENGWEGKVGAGLTALGNAAGLGIPKLLMRAIAPERAYEVDRAQEANPRSTLAGSLAGGAAAFAAPIGAAGRIGMAAYEGGTSALDQSIKSGDWENAVKSGDYSSVAEHFAQGVGIGGTLGAVVEGGAYTLGKLASAAQKATKNTLAKWSEKGIFERVEEMGQQANRYHAAAQDIGMQAQQAEQSSAQYLRDLGAPREPSAVPRPYAGMTEKPPPLPDLPFAQAESVPESVAGENIAKARAQGMADNKSARMLADEPLSESQSAELRGQYDHSAQEAAEMQPWEGEGDNARAWRAERDRVPEGLTPDELAAWKKQRTEFTVHDPEIQGAFDRAGFNAPAEPFAPTPQPESAVTEIPTQRPLTPTEDLPAARVKMPSAKEFAAPSKLKGLAASEGVTGPELKGSADIKLPKLPRKFGTQEATELGDKSLPFEQAKYRIKAGKEPSIPGIARDVGIAGIGAAIHHTNPFLGYMLGGHAAYAALRNSANEMGMLAQRTALNRSDAINIMVSRVISGPMQQYAKVVRSLLQAGASQATSTYLSGDTAKDYEDIVKSVTAAQANPEAIGNYQQQKYGALAEDPKFMSALAAQQLKGAQYIAGAIPQRSRAPGLLDDADAFDPPHSVKLRVIQRYNAVNDPHSVLATPDYESLAAVQAVHPNTLSEFRRQLAEQLTDAKKRANLSPAQRRDISVVMGTPTDWINSPEGIAALASVGTAASTPPQGAQGSNGAKQGAAPNRGVNLGGLSESYATMVAPPSEQDELKNNQ